MHIFLDLEETLLTDEKELLPETKKSLIACDLPITILTEATLKETNQIIQQPSIEIVSVLENKCMINEKVYCPAYLSNEKINQVLEQIPIITAYSIFEQTEIISFQPRLLTFYPNQELKLVHHFSADPAFLMIAVERQYQEVLEQAFAGNSIVILGSDEQKSLLRITATPSTKESWLKVLKKSPAIGIGDSLQDYSFIRHCEYQVAMKNATDDLKGLCDTTTSFDNNQNGAMQFILDFLTHQPF